jgi:hypothetical protein
MTELHPKEGDIIQIGIPLLNAPLYWSTHQVVRRISNDGIPIYRPRDAKVNKYAEIWRFPVENREKIIKDLKHYANPQEAKKAIAELRQAKEREQDG